MSVGTKPSNNYPPKSLAVCSITASFVCFLGYKLWKSYGLKSNQHILKIHKTNPKQNKKKKPVTYIALNELHEFETNMFVFFGVPQSDAIAAANVLCSADKRGIDSHGVARLQTYFEKLCKKLINATPKIKIIRESETTATIDGDGGLGLVVGCRAIEIAISKAVKYGSGWVAVCNSNHYGIAAYYSMKALRKQCIGISMTNTSPLVAPTYGLERMLGTNPISMAFPGQTADPIVVDMATSVVPLGKIEEARRKREQIPDGWAIDQYGNTINDPHHMISDANSCQLPLGSTEKGQSHKGYCLSAMVDLLCAVLSGANYGKHVEPFCEAGHVYKPKETRGKGRGHFFGALRIDGFRDVNQFKMHVDKWRQDMYECKSLPNKHVLVPGDPESKHEKIRSKTGVPVKYVVVCDLIRIAKYCNIQLPKILQ